MIQAPTWAGDPAASAKFDRNAIELPRYANIEQNARQAFQQTVSDYLSNKITDAQLHQQFSQQIMDAQAEAFVAGRRARGDIRDGITDAEEAMLVARHEEQMKYFRGFAADMKAGRGKVNYVARAGMYSESLWSVYTRGETSDWESPETENCRYYWVLDVEADHCKTCIERARMSRDQDGFTWEEIAAVGWPGENTDCGRNCRCHVRKVCKSVVLPERIDQAEPAESSDEGFRSLEELLGGQGLPLKIPAAGVPYVAANPLVVKDSVAQAPNPEQLAQRLPTIPKALTKPAQIIENQGWKLYVGDEIEVLIGRNDDGLWQIVSLFLPAEERRAA